MDQSTIDHCGGGRHGRAVMKTVLTLTLNPAIDGACEADRVRPTHKIRTSNERYDPGGGGINVARVVHRLGGRVTAAYLAGGATGDVLDSLLERDGIACQRFDIADHTRISHAVFEQATGLEYRFVPEGPMVTADEWRACLSGLAAMACDYLVLSGSLPRGVPDDVYVQFAGAAQALGAEVVLDTSGSALVQTLAAGGLLLVKPSRGELEKLAGKTLDTPDLLAATAGRIVAAGQARYVAVTMGHEGAMLIGDGLRLHLPALPVDVKSATGAGDSFVGGMVHALAQGQTIADAFRLGMAAGTAAVLTPGTDLCRAEDVAIMLDRLNDVRNV
jgi:6-phosphofructokinase 2